MTAFAALEMSADVVSAACGGCSGVRV